MREFKFRYWDDYIRRFVHSDDFEWNDAYNKISHFFSHASRYANDTVQQYTGLKDKNKQEIYEGDILNVKYIVGDFAWEFMSDEELDQNTKMDGKEYVAEVKQSLGGGNNLELVAKIDVGNGFIIFPLSYIKLSSKIGNVFENPELLITNKL